MKRLFRFFTIRHRLKKSLANAIQEEKYFTLALQIAYSEDETEEDKLSAYLYSTLITKQEIVYILKHLL